MLSAVHELLVDLLREGPEFARDLVDRALRTTDRRADEATSAGEVAKPTRRARAGKQAAEPVTAALPPHTAVRVADADLSQLVPTALRADLVLQLENQGRPVFAVICEAQLNRDARKRYVWPLYEAALRARLRCPVALLIITHRPPIARWAGQAIALGPHSRCQPLVLGPHNCPRVVPADLERVDRSLAILSGLVHKHSPGALETIYAAAVAAGGLDPDRAVVYHDVLLADLDEETRRQLEEKMLSRKHEWQSEIGRTSYQAGKAEGKAEGIDDGRQRVLLKQLRLKFPSQVSPEVVARVTQGHGDLLDLWAERILSATTLAEVFGDPEA